MRIYVDGVVESKYKSLLLLKFKHSKVFDVAGTDSSNRAYYGKKAHYYLYNYTKVKNHDTLFRCYIRFFHIWQKSYCICEDIR